MLTDYEDSQTLKPYYEALMRLVLGIPQRVPVGTKISLKSVALEAGKTEGSIKKSRAVFANLITEIKSQAKKQLESLKPGSFEVRSAKLKTEKAKSSAAEYEEKYKAALGRELMLLVQLDKLEQQISKINNVTSIKKR